MAEEKARILKVLEALSQCTDPARPSDIGNIMGETPFNVGHDLYELGKGGLAEKRGKKKKSYLITDKGREILKNPPAEWFISLAETPSGTPSATPSATPSETPSETPSGTPSGTPPPATSGPPPVEETVPSQADLFKAEGQLIGFGTRKGDIKLDTVVNYVERVANLDDLSSVWNALTEMRVANDVKKAWVRLYAQNLPGKEIPAELKAKLEVGTEAEKVTTEGTVATKPKRFSVVNSEIIGDPEGDYSFKEALQVVAQEKGASPAQAAEMATTFAKMNADTMNLLIPLLTKDTEKGASPAQAAEMATTFAKMNTDTMNLLIPLLTKEPGGDTITKLLLTQMDNLQKEIRSGQGSSETTQQLQALTQQLDQLRETLHNEQLARIQEQNQATTKELIGYIKSLDNKIEAATKGKEVESRIGLMSKALDKGAEQLSGIRQDIKPLAQSFIDRGAAPGEKTATEKKGFGTGLDRGIERAKEATELEDMLFFGKGS